jgi:peptide deformylase
MSTSPLDLAADAFASELARWRAERGLSKKQLAAEMGFDPSYVSHVEGRRHRPTEDFAKRAESVLEAGGAIWARFHEYDELRRAPRAAPAGGREGAGGEHWSPRGTGLIVEQEIARLSYEEGVYRCQVRRWLYNAGPEPVTRYPARVAVDRYPGDAARSNRYYREHPLTWEELKLSAVCGEAPGGVSPGERMSWHPIHDRDSFKEVWLLFENDQTRFPLYPGQRTTIEYSYQLGNDKWGQWFQRSIRIPTRRLTVRLEFPLALQPAVWGVQTSLTAESVPLPTAPSEQVDGDRISFEWSTEGPPLYTRYRLEWRFRSGGAQAADQRQLNRRASEWMASLGIVQRGADQLGQQARPVELPAQESVARDVVSRLLNALDRIGDVHTFGKGVGLAAPQIGLCWAVAVVQPPEQEAEPIVLVNPRVVAASAETDEQYEGCLSFFDVRGLVRRPLRLEVEHSTADGTRAITVFEQGLARLVAHEIDHLEGRLYVDRMPAGAVLVPVEEYHGVGSPWRY